MPTNQTLEVVLHLRDEATQALGRAVQAAESSLRKLGEGLRDLGRQMSQAGRNMAFLGAAITGSFGVAFATAQSRVPAVRDALRALQNQTVSLQVTVAEALVPVLNGFANALGNLARWFKSLDPGLRDALLRVALLSGAFLTVAGVTVNLGGKLLILAGTVARVVAAIGILPIAIAALITVIVLLLQKFGLLDDILRIIGGSLAVIGQAFVGLSQVIAASLLKVLAFVIGRFEDLFDILGRLPSRFGGEAFRDMADRLKEVREGLDEFSLRAAEQGVEKLMTLKEAFDRGAISAEEFARRVREGLDALTGKAAPALDTLQARLEAFSDEMKRFLNEISDPVRRAAEFMRNLFQGMASGFSSAIEKFITQGGKFKDFLKEMGRAVLRAFISAISQLIAQILATLLILFVISRIPVIGPLVVSLASIAVTGQAMAQTGMLTGAIASSLRHAQELQSRHHGGVVQRFQTGGEVMALLEPGEFVVNRQATQRNRQLLETINRGGSMEQGAGQIVFINVSAIDTRTGTEFLLRNSKAIAEAVGLEIMRNNQPFRRVNRRFA